MVNVASRYLQALETGTPTPSRKPLSSSNVNLPSSRGKSLDLAQLARDMDIDTESPRSSLKDRYNTPSATVSSFKTTPSSTSSSLLSTDTSSPAYEYLCRVQALKSWLEDTLGERISLTPADLVTGIRNGIPLAKLANAFLPSNSRRSVYTADLRLEFRHTENINQFFRLFRHLDVPDIFRFELTDLYDSKDIPKVWLCLHAVATIISARDGSIRPPANLVGLLQFTAADLKLASRALGNHGLPNFSSVDSDRNGDHHSSYMATAMLMLPGKSPVATPLPNKKSNTFSTLPATTPLTPGFQASQKMSGYQSTHKTSGRGLGIYSGLGVQHDNEENPFVSSATTKPGLNFGASVASADDVNVVKLQALARGALFRYSMFVDKIMLRSYDAEMTTLFSVIRGNLVRGRTVHRHRDEIRLFEKEIIAVQTAARLRMSRRRWHVTLGIEAESNVSALQHVARGRILRKRVGEIKNELCVSQSNVIQLQSLIRRAPVYRCVSQVAPVQKQLVPVVTEFQAVCRRVLYKQGGRSAIFNSENVINSVVELQSLARAAVMRGHLRVQLRQLHECRHSIFTLQCVSRGGLARTRIINGVLFGLMDRDDMLSDLVAKARGDRIRREIAATKTKLSSVNELLIIDLQSRFRGILVRFRLETAVDDLYEQVSHVITLQSSARGALIRMDLKHMKTYYSTRVDKVVRAQAILRSKYTQAAYRQLISMRDPPVSVVRQFAHLLSESGIAFTEEAELLKLKDHIVEKASKAEDLEQQIDHLDIKLGLLDKNKISIEDFVKNGPRFKTYKPPQASTAVRQLDGINPRARQRLDLYSHMLYFLQTKPAYWINLYKHLSQPSTLRSLQYHILQLFPLYNCSITEHSREEYFFIKFICALMEHDIRNRCSNIADITKAKLALWIEFLVDLNNQIYQRTHLKQLMGKVVQAICDDEELTFEPDPSRIHENLRGIEIRVHGMSEKPKDILPQDAIKLPEVSTMFVQNLMALREATTALVDLLRVSVLKLPLHVRVLANKAYKLSQIQFPELAEDSHLAVAGVIIIKLYIGNLLQFPENFGYSTRDPYSSSPYEESRIKNNLKYLGRSLLQLFSMRPFSDNFLKPLNDYVMSNADSTKEIIRSIIDIKDLEAEYEMNDYEDLVAKVRPSLTMKVSEMIAIERIVRDNIEDLAPSEDDQLHGVVSELMELATSAADYLALSEMGNYTLNLAPSTKEESVTESKVKNLFSQAKRCLIYILRVEEGDDLLELFIHGIKPLDEAKFRELVKEENESNHRSKNPLGDLSRMSYMDLKRQALEVILQLENKGLISRKNSFQALLNLIVVDIKTKHSQRTNISSQLKIAEDTIKKLTEKERLLKNQLDDYNAHIDRVLTELQLRPKDRKIFNVIPVFSKQYFYHRQLKKNNRLPKFGSYKYSAKKLIDMNVLIDFGGELHVRNASASKLDFMFGCHKTGMFVIEAANGSVTVPGACASITLDDLLDRQYAKEKEWKIFDGNAVFDTENLAALIFRKFYDIKKD